MSEDAQARLYRIQKVSAWVKGFSAFCLFLIGAGYLLVSILVLSGQEDVDLALPGQTFSFSAQDMSFGTRWLVVIFVGMMLAILFKAFFHLHRLFGNYNRGEIFTAGSVGQIKQIGKLILFFGLFRLLIVPLMTALIASSANLESSVRVTLPLAELLIGGITMTIAWVMDMGRELREESDLVV